MGLILSEHTKSPVSPPEGITLRVMKASDLPHVRALHRNLLPVSYPAAFFLQILVNPRRLCLVATDHGAIVGFASAAMGLAQPDVVGGHIRDDKEYPESHSDIPRSQITLLTLGVLPSYQRRGIGRALVHGVVQRLEAAVAPGTQPHVPISESDGGSKVSILVQVQVARSNSAGKRFYTHLGMIDQRVPDDPRFHIGLGSRTSVMAGVLCV